jgi:hypothetical protein
MLIMIFRMITVKYDNPVVLKTVKLMTYDCKIVWFLFCSTSSLLTFSFFVAVSLVIVTEIIFIVMRFTSVVKDKNVRQYCYFVSSHSFPLLRF